MWIFLKTRDIIKLNDEYLVGLNSGPVRWIPFLQGNVGIGQTKRDFRVVRRKISQDIKVANDSASHNKDLLQLLCELVEFIDCDLDIQIIKKGPLYRDIKAALAQQQQI